MARLENVFQADETGNKQNRYSKVKKIHFKQNLARRDQKSTIHKEDVTPLIISTWSRGRPAS